MELFHHHKPHRNTVYFAAIAIVAAVAAIATMAMTFFTREPVAEQSAPVKTVVNEMPQSDQFAPPAASSEETEKVPVPTPPVNMISAALDVAWLAEPVSLSLTEVLSQAEVDWLKKEYTGSNEDLGRAIQTGRVRGGSFDGHKILTVATIPLSLEWPNPTYRVLRDPTTGDLRLLEKYSEPIPAEMKQGLKETLPNVRIPSIDRIPSSFQLRGLSFDKPVNTFWGRSDLWGDAPLTPLATHPVVGTIYTTPTNGSNALYARFPDYRFVPYFFDIPFMRDRSIAQIRWNDGSENTDDYSTVDRGGCGASNQYAVRAEDVVRPTERLVAAGTAVNGNRVYTIRDANDPELKSLYEQYTPYLPDGGSKISYDAFVARRPVFYWKDPFARWVRFVRADIMPAAECGKPVIYLYPEKEQRVQVRVALKGTMTVSEPPHGTKGWDVIARPDGYVVNRADGKTYPNLFWEGTGVAYAMPTEGFVIKRADADAWFRTTLATIGFTERESGEFREFWVDRLPHTPYVFITFIPQADFDRDAALHINPKPDRVYRIFFESRGLSEPITLKAQHLPRIERTGFTVVEWGGALRK